MQLQFLQHATLLKFQFAIWVIWSNLWQHFQQILRYRLCWNLSAIQVVYEPIQCKGFSKIVCNLLREPKKSWTSRLSQWDPYLWVQDICSRSVCWLCFRLRRLTSKSLKARYSQRCRQRNTRTLTHLAIFYLCIVESFLKPSVMETKKKVLAAANQRMSQDILDESQTAEQDPLLWTSKQIVPPQLHPGNRTHNILLLPQTKLQIFSCILQGQPPPNSLWLSKPSIYHLKQKANINISLTEASDHKVTKSESSDSLSSTLDRNTEDSHRDNGLPPEKLQATKQQKNQAKQQLDTNIPGCPTIFPVFSCRNMKRILPVSWAFLMFFGPCRWATHTALIMHTTPSGSAHTVAKQFRISQPSLFPFAIFEAVPAPSFSGRMEAVCTTTRTTKRPQKPQNRFDSPCVQLWPLRIDLIFIFLTSWYFLHKNHKGIEWLLCSHSTT